MGKQVVSLEPIQINEFVLNIKGDTPLLMHKFSDENKQDLLDKQQHKTKQLSKRDFNKEVEDCVYWVDKKNKKVGYPASAFKKAMVEVAPYLKNMDKKKAKGSFFVIGQAANDIVPIVYKEQVVNEAVVRLSGANKAAFVRYRPEFREWECEILIKYNEEQISAEQIVALANLAGFHIGIGDWRPQCSGTYGMFQVHISDKKPKGKRTVAV
jgi:hypothetical protein